MDLGGEGSRPRIVGDYVIGDRIGWGSFAVVWRSRHRTRGTEFAIKEIDKKHLNEQMMKEISILRHINHPNIIRLFEAIETDHRIFLVLEYCDGGDLGAYLHKHGRVSVDVARHFMRQLAAGLQVLRENHLIHRDLKPQNLLLSSKDVIPSLKIGDFGFARYLTSDDDLAKTFCGSPLYMAPEIIQNQKYDAKADLWSVGAILFQLVIGRPPYCGNSPRELFQNVLSSSELQFPQAALLVLHPDFVDLCRRLLRRNPVERLTFEELFNHNFLLEPRVTEEREVSNPVSKGKSLSESTECSRDEVKIQDPGDQPTLANRNESSHCASPNDERNSFPLKDHTSVSGAGDARGFVPYATGDTRPSADVDPNTSYQHRVVDSMELIEREYVLVNSPFASMESLASSTGRTLLDSSSAGACGAQPETNIPSISKMKDIATSSIGRIVGKPSTVFSVSREGQGTSETNPSKRLHMLQHYAHALSVLAQEKLKAGSLLESLSLELTVLVIWKEVIQICSSRLASLSTSSCKETANQAGAGCSCLITVETCAFPRPPTAGPEWATGGFVAACERTEKLADLLQKTDVTATVPDAIELIYKTALASGKSGAVDELVENRVAAASSYSKAMLLLSFIVSEAPLLSLNPPFSLHPDDKKRIRNYIKRLDHHRKRLRALQQHPSEQPSTSTK